MEKEILLNRFTGQGMVDEKRDIGLGNFRYLENVAHNDFARGIKQVGDVTITSNSTRHIVATLSIGDYIYGLGKDSNDYFTIYTYNGTTWDTGSTPGSGYHAFVDSENPFFVYNNGFIYFQNGNYIGRAVCTGGSIGTMVGEWSAGAAHPILGGMTGNDGNLYGWYGTGVYQIVVATGSATKMIDVPTDQTIVEIVNYTSTILAFICTARAYDSKMFLWDYSSTTSFYNIVSIGKGVVAGGALIDGVIKVIIGGVNNKDFRIRTYSGGVFSTEFYYSGRANTSGTVTTILISRVKSLRNYIYFLVSGTRPNTTSVDTVTLFRYGNKITGTINSLCAYKAFGTAFSNSRECDFTIIDGASTSPNYFSVFASDFSSNKEVLTNGLFTQAGIIETGIITGGDSSIEKQLKDLSIQCSPLTSGQSIKLSYKPDANTTWIEIITISEVGTISYEPVSEADGSNLRTSKEVALQIQQIGGAELTGLYAKYQELTGTQI